MRSPLHPILALVFLLSATSVVTAQEAAPEVAPQSRGDAIRSAKIFLEGLQPHRKCPLKVDTAPARSIGVKVAVDPYPLFLFVPSKDLETAGIEGKGAETEYGVPVGYLFAGIGFGNPVINGQLADWQGLGHTVVQDPKIGLLYFNCMILSASRSKDGTHRLHLFGDSARPLLSVPLEKANKSAKAETALKVKDLDIAALRLKLSLNLGKWEASLPFGARPHP